MNADHNTWYAVSVTVKTAATEAIEFAFNTLDSLGTEINDMPKADRDSVTVIGYFQDVPEHDLLRSELDKAVAVYGLPADSIAAVTTAEVKNEDWLAEWKKHWKPTNIGRFVIAAPWHEVDDTNKIVIRIEPNMAFGTGTHETTQLCLAAIDEHYRAGQSFLDVGTGTGILAIAAAKMTEGSKIIACDTDNEAVTIARENAALNGVGDQIEFFTGPISEEIDSFDFVCANLTADVIIPILPLLIKKTRSTLVMSGILAEQEESILNALPERFNGSKSVTCSGEWISLTVRMD
jgi:ribosomal protein L11 methyltransferase